MIRARTSPHRPPSHRLAAAGALLAALAGCSPPEAAPPVTPTIAVAETRAPDGPPEPEAEAAPEPADLLGVVRVGSPLRELAAWRDLLPAHTVFGQLASHGAAAVAMSVLGSLGEHVDVGAPLDVAILDESDGGGPPFVASVVLRDAGEAQRKAAADFEFVPLPDGSVAVKPRRGAKNVGLVARFELACAILRGGAPRAAHLVCAGDRERLAQAGPYLARTVALEPAGDGLQVEIPEAALGRKLAAYTAGDEDGDDGDDAADGAMDRSHAAGRRMAKALVGQFAGDFSKIALGASASPSGVAIGLDLRFRSLRSPLSVALVGTRGQGVPDTFWKMPADADLALYFPGAPPATLRGAFEPIWTELGEILPDDDGVQRETWRAFASRMKDLFFTGGPLLVAHGPAAAPAKAPARAADPKKQHQAARAAAAGWTLFGAPEPASKWVTGLQGLLTLDEKAGSKKAGGAKGGAGATKKKAHRDRSTYRVLKIAASEKLPAGSLHFVIRTTPEPGYTPAAGGEPPLEAAYEEHVFVAGSEEHTWIALSENEALARAKVREALAPDGAGLAGRAELAPIRALPPGGVGFVTLRGVLALDDGADTPAQLAAAQAEQQALAALPSAGLAPMFVSSSPVQEGEGASLRIGGALSIAAALDLIRWVQE